LRTWGSQQKVVSSAPATPTASTSQGFIAAR
jgi:hypothetical protein